MKLYTTLIAALIFTTALSAFAKPLPPVQAPRELSEGNGEFSEGTITRLSPEDIAQYIPFAQNAQSVLSKALMDIENMRVEDQVKHLTAVIKAVVRNSGQKNYQTFMRFALNRTLLLVQELVGEADWRNPGTAENVLDLQVKGIQLALRFYESDLAYQRRVNDGQDTVNLDYASFATAFGVSMLTSIQNVYDASAQYRLLYKTLEMINWDLSRDRYAVDVSDIIIEIYNTLYTLNENPAPADMDNILNIRRLNSLIISVNKVEGIIKRAKEQEANTIQQQREHERRVVIRNRFKISVGLEVIYNTKTQNPLIGTIHEIRENEVVLKKSNSSFITVSRDDISFMSGCFEDVCVGDVLINLSRKLATVKVRAISMNDTFVIEYLDGEVVKLDNRLGGGWTPEHFAKTTGCADGLCVGDIVYNLTKQTKTQIIGIQPNNKFVLLFLEGKLKGLRGENWTKSDLTKI